MVFESILNPKRSERRPWEMLFVGFVYASLSVLLVTWVFSGDIVLVKYSGIFIVTFTVMFSIPFFYFMLKVEEQKDSQIEESFSLLREHWRAVHSLLWLFIGFVIGFSLLFILVGNTDNFRAQIETFCVINSPNNFESCISQYGVRPSTTGFVAGLDILGGIFTNNLYVLIFTILFSVLFRAGGIFILAWNATVISAAVVIFSKSDLLKLPLALSRYLIHGIPEIAAYFVGTLAGGIFGMAIIRKEFKTEKFWNILYDSLLLILVAIMILLVAALIEVYITPKIF